MFSAWSKRVRIRVDALKWRLTRLFLTWIPISWRVAENDRFISQHEYHNLLAEGMIQGFEQASIKLEDVPEALEKLKPEYPNFVKIIGDQQYVGLTNWTPVIIRSRKAQMKRFRKTHNALWGKGLTKLQALIVAATEIGEEANRALRSEDKPERRARVEVLTRLHARSIYLAQEIHCLMDNGYPDGALARWRALHEIAVVSNFLAMGPDDQIARYFEHNAIESWKAAEEFNAHAAANKEISFPPDHMAKLKARYEELEQKYGKSYTQQYGWAAESLKLNYRFGLGELEKAAGLEHWRPHYRMASHPTHANAKGIRFQLGDFDGSGVLVAGPSNYGLLDPAQCAAGSVFYCTLPLLNLRDDLYALVMKHILLKFVDDVGAEFFNVQEMMKGHDAAPALTESPDGL